MTTGKKRSRLKWLLIPLAALLLFGGYYVWNAYSSWNQVYQEHNQTGERPVEPVSPVPVQEPLNKTTYSFLLLGVDSGNVEKGRSDSNMLAVANAQTQQISLLSIPRDTYLPIQGHGKEKLAHAYAYGGAGLAVKTVEDFLATPVDHYVAFNFNGVQKFVDALGGLSVDVEKDMDFDDRITHKHVYLKKGRQTLNGEQTLNYARYRGDADGDLARMRRQQQVVKELLTQTVNYRNVAKINRFLKIMGDNVRTDIPIRRLLQFAGAFSTLTGSQVDTIPMEAAPSSINGVSYMLITAEERRRVQAQLQALIQGGGQDRAPEPVTHSGSINSESSADAIRSGGLTDSVNRSGRSTFGIPPGFPDFPQSRQGP
ncbi:LCP family protein [Paenibacillus sp. FJAT-26967]|uniref:LCP family protein n=1 Tax=Paenibacillus sp. FJAT-26967 TaxID=1729690 RepID=UPI000A05AF5D|nr:LCP family protein [Paenibacillus sp. FJAT-26967]